MQVSDNSSSGTKNKCFIIVYIFIYSDYIYITTRPASHLRIEKFRQLIHSHIHIFGHVICLDVRGSGNKEQLLVLRTRSTAEALLRHVEGIGNAAGHHQQRTVYQIHIRRGVKCHQVHKAALGIAER